MKTIVKPRLNYLKLNLAIEIKDFVILFVLFKEIDNLNHTNKLKISLFAIRNE